MNSRELKHFHNENYTHVTKKEYSGAEISAENAVNAPMDLKIYGASEQTADYVMCEGVSKQTVTEQGKNLMDKERYITFPDGAASVVGFDLSLLELGKTYTFYTSTPCTFTKISNSHGGYNCAVKWLNGEDFTSWTFTHTRHSNIPAGNKLYLFIAFNSMNFSTDIGDFEGVDIQIEEGNTLTDYEAFVPDSPSPDYPSEITPLVAAGTYKIGTKGARYLIELPDMYEAGGACDKLMFDKISKTARLKQEIDPGLLDPAKTIEENTQAVLAEPVYTELAVTKTSWTSWTAPYAEVPWKIYGKNLFSTERYVYSGQLKYTNISNNSFKFEGSNTSSNLPLVYYSLNLSAGTYRLTFKSTLKNSVSSELRPNEMMIRKNSYSGDIVGMWKMGGDCENKQRSYAFTINEDCTKLFFNFYPSVLSTVLTDYLMLIEDIQLEKASSATDFEAYNAAPPESLTPSADYPHKIYTSREMTLKCTGGDTVNSTKIPLMGNAMEVSDIAQSNLVLDGKYYLSDYIEYNSAADKAYRHKFIDDTLFDTALPIKDQTQAILAEPTVEEITVGDGEYSFKEAKSVQDGCTLNTESYSTDGLPHPKPLYIEAKIKVIKG